MTHRVFIFAGLLGLPLLPGCEKKVEESGAGAEISETDGGKAQRQWTCEEHWMVEGTVRDLQGMAKLCGAGDTEKTVPTAKSGHEYQVGKAGLKMSPSCWDIASYRPLLEEWKITQQAASDNAPDLLHDLLTPTAKVLQKANKEISERIKTTPAAARVHEEAAFLLGVFGLRHNAQQFNDLRPLLCRMTAHLAFAEKLREGKPPSDAGRWAEVLYDCHAGRPVKAREKMKSIPTEGDSGRWKRVVDLHVTGDWRRMQDLAEPSLAEAIVHARALKTHRGNPELMAFVTEREDLQATPEWSRLLSQQDRSVDDGHLAMRSGVTMEFFEAGEVFNLGKEPTPDKIAAFLAKDGAWGLVGKDGGPRVISDADWAGYFRRHFHMVCANVSRFALRQWGSHEAAVAWEKEVLPYCRKLPDVELIEPLVATREKDFQDDMRKVSDYARKHPERIPMGLWFDYRFPNLNVRPGTAMPNQEPWFREVSPPGTAHDPIHRIRFTGIQGGDWVKQIKALHKIDPWNRELCYELAENTGNNIESVKAAWGEVREYSKRPLNQILEGPRLTADERIETLRTFMSFDPDAGLDLGDALVIAGQPEEAHDAYETAYEKSPDRVGVSNKTRWLIHYYKSSGNDARAREIADHNEQVFSHEGLESAFVLAIRDKDAKRAKKIAEDIAERYDDHRYGLFAAWHGDGDESALREVFPNGLQDVTTADFEDVKSPKGCRLDKDSVVTRSVGVRSGDIVVAVDGKRVETMLQYDMLMRPILDPHTRLIIRRGRQVLEIDCQLPNRRLQVDMRAVGG
ncbi:hypothetical protein JIN84_11175 [Luteolibacter yonseiensis]|uniref:PDZ domain-containing protein n=1 Tax=Luteolibacter yonseiensis TaxID=1144680 RepID=A0A934R357_9BACT|nr:hypothetical protein [Luteolibacter yonseiensis]MBK1816176.1 hypothetical protein [Luteolibacter yonseiensis]